MSNILEPKILFRVYVGGREGNQNPHFLHAFGKIMRIRQYDIETKNCDDIKKLNWDPKEFIDWLLGIDIINQDNFTVIFIILGHIHQVISKYISYDISFKLTCSHLLKGLDRLCWDISELWREYSRLRDGIGYPNGLDCPVFLQVILLF